MKWLSRSALALVLLLALLAAGAFLYLPHLARSDAVRDEIQEMARVTLDMDLSWERIDLSFSPLSLVVEGAVLETRVPDDPPFLTASRSVLRIVSSRLLDGQVVLDRIDVESPVVHLVRRAETFDPPGTPDREKAAQNRKKAGRDRDRISIELYDVLLHGGEIHFEDRKVSPAVALGLREVEARLTSESPRESLRVELTAAGSDGGNVSISGTVEPGSGVDLEADLEKFQISALGSYADFASGWRGAATGSASLEGSVGRPKAFRVNVTLDESAVAFDEFALRGRFDARVKLSGPWKKTSGRFDVDATEATLDLGGAFVSQPGVKKTVKGRIVSRRKGGIELDDVELKVKSNGPAPSR